MRTKTKTLSDGLAAVTCVDRIQHLTHELRSAKRRVGLVPTMGALHEGHLSLVRASQAGCDQTIVTIFVNPTQFAPQEDFRTYPRHLEDDLVVLKEIGVEHVFAPTTDVLYPPGFSTHVDPPAVARRWEGEHRPGHFRGVATVVLKLFNLIPAQVAYFGAKDYQQCLVVRDMVADLHLPIRLQICPTVRDDDGLALSSRNDYLSEAERRQAHALPASLVLARRLFDGGERNAARIANAARAVLASAGVDRLDYLAVTDPDTLEPLVEIADAAVVLLAAYAGKTRLIDNALLGGDERNEDRRMSLQPPASSL